MAIVRAAQIIVLFVLIEQVVQTWQTSAARPEKQAVCREGGQAQAHVRSRTCKPDCPACRAEGTKVTPPPRPAPRVKKKAGCPRSVKTDLYYCPCKECTHYGWVGLDNIIANGHPSGGQWRQLYCTVCGTYFMETSGTIFYRSPLPPDKLCPIIAALAEGLGLQAIARVFEVDVDTVKSCLTKAAEHMDAVSNYLIHYLHLTQVQVDELWALVQSWGEEPDTAAVTRRHDRWVWAGIDPTSKLLLSTVVGGRTLVYAQLLIHAIMLTLAPGVVPLFLSDQLVHYTTALLTHFGHWVEMPRRSKYGPAPKPLWEPLPALN